LENYVLGNVFVISYHSMTYYTTPKAKNIMMIQQKREKNKTIKEWISI